MTEDQIKAIAEEYARQNPPSTTDEILKREIAKLNAEQVFEPFLCFLATRYCIVEREKVKKAIHILQEDADMSKFKAECDGAISVLENLFGTSMFNPNET